MLEPPQTEAQQVPDVQEEEGKEYQKVNGKIVKSTNDTHLSTSSGMWLKWCSSSLSNKSYWEAYQMVNSEANYRHLTKRADQASGTVTGT